MLDRVRGWNWERIGWVMAIETALLMVGAAWLLPGGEDLHRYYRPFAAGDLERGFAPYFTHWIIWPLSLIPQRLAWPVWTAVTVGGILLICLHGRVNPAPVMLSFPMFGQVWLGQIDVVVCAGLALALRARNPYLRGLGIALALAKPQISVLALLFLLTQEKRRDLLRMVLAPTALVIASLIAFGPRWPVEWLSATSNRVPPHVWRRAMADLWPFGLPLVLLPLLIHARKQRFAAGLLVAPLATPFYGIYSCVVPLVFTRSRWWILPLSWVWLLVYPLWHQSLTWLPWALPAGLLAVLVSEGRSP